MSAVLPNVPALRWLRPDAYHYRSECGRFTVARLQVVGSLHYTANEIVGGKTHELASRVVPITASLAAHVAARDAMQQVCQERAQ